jgi:hypothetical protein
MIILIASCKKPYEPNIAATGNNYLVVEGTINTGADSTIIKLSRTVDLSGKVSTAAESNASVNVESDQNEVYILKAVGNGTYASASLNLDNTKKYRLSIITADGKFYKSDFVAGKTAPPIDSVGYTIKNNGLQVYVNTHDQNNSTTYYRWDYEETWQFHAKYFSVYVSNGTAMVERTSAQDIYYCFSHDVSNTINLGSSARLKQDVIYQAPITVIPSTSEKIEAKYSILLKQYALTPEAYAFYQNLKKNTEQVGSIFDAQPSELKGNIHNVNDAKETVIGYISAGNVQTKRIFISNADLPRDWVAAYPYGGCRLDSTYFVEPFTHFMAVQELLIALPPVALGISEMKGPDGRATVGYMRSTTECADCTIRGTKKQPDFWK